MDRFLVNDKWFGTAEWKVSGLFRKSSDYSALVLFSNTVDWGPKPVKIFDIWYTNIDCRNLVQTKLQELQRLNIPLQTKLRLLRKGIQKWNVRYNGQCATMIRKLEEELKIADGQGDTVLANNIQTSLKEKYEENESILRQKAKMMWLDKGDSNSSFFHNSIKSKQCKSNIQGMMHEGVWITNPTRI